MIIIDMPALIAWCLFVGLSWVAVYKIAVAIERIMQERHERERAFRPRAPNPTLQALIGLKVRRTNLRFELEKAIKAKKKRSHIVARLTETTNEILRLEAAARQEMGA